MNRELMSRIDKTEANIKVTLTMIGGLFIIVGIMASSADVRMLAKESGN